AGRSSCARRRSSRCFPGTRPGRRTLLMGRASWARVPAAAVAVVLAALVLSVFLPAGAANAPALRITYPADGTLFPPEIVAPTFTWEDAGGAARWDVVVRDAAGAELAKESVDAPRSRRRGRRHRRPRGGQCR